MSQSITIDIIIPLYNKAATIGRALDSILAQSFTDWRVIVIDDGSSDNGPHIVRQYQERDSRFILLTQKNQGPGAARNRGIKEATALFIAFLDADDEWFRDYLSEGLKPLVRKKKPVTLSCCYYTEIPEQKNMMDFWQRQGVRPGRYELTGKENPVEVEALLGFMHVGTTIINRSAIMRYDGFYEQGCRYAEDSVFFMRLGINEPFEIIATVGTCHHRCDSELSYMHEKPMPPFLEDPSIILDYCYGDRKSCMEQILFYLALHRARFYARKGQPQQARKVLSQFETISQSNHPAIKKLYRRYQRDIRFSHLLPIWVRFKMKLLRLLGRI